jgi:hypothetical protein
VPIFIKITDLLTGLEKGSATVVPGVQQTQQNPQVTLPLSDSRTGQLQVSMYEPVAGQISAGDTAAKVLYRNPNGTNMLVLNGIVVLPTSDFDAGTVAFTVHDPTLRLKHRYLSWDHVSILLGRGLAVDSPVVGSGAYGTPGFDPGVDAFSGGSFEGVTSVYGVPLDGKGLRVLVYDAASLPATALTGGTPPFGIRGGKDDSTPQPVYVTAGLPPSGVGGLRSDGHTVGVGFTATATAGSDTLTGVDFTGSTNADGSTPTIADILEYARIDCDAYPTLLPFTTGWCSVVSASGTSIVMSEKATATMTVTNGFTTEDAIYCQLTRGDCIYDDILDMVQAVGSFECDWIPVDFDHLGESGDTWVQGEMCELYTADRIGTDRSQGNPEGNTPVVFVHGEGGFHLTFAPDADQMVTMDTEVGPGGQSDPNDYFNKVSIVAASSDDYGIYQNWMQAQAAGNGDSPISNALLANRAVASLTAYQYPPKFMTAKIDSDKVAKYIYGDDFWLGDTVTVYGHKGHVTLGPMSVRITQVGLTQTDENGNVQIDLEMVPHIVVKPLHTRVYP